MSDETSSSGSDSTAGQQQSKVVKENLKRGSTWLRLFFIYKGQTTFIRKDWSN